MNMDHRHHLTLSPEERDALNNIAAAGNAAEARRARIVLLTAEGQPQAAIAAQIGLSERQVRRWQRAFEAGRMGIFSQDRTAEGQALPPMQAQDTHQPTEAEKPAKPKKQPKPEPAPPPGLAQPRRELKLLKSPGVRPDDPMSEAGRKILHYHFERMLLNEPGSRLGEDIEAVHDMRVATRRMRSALVIFEPFYQRKVIRPLARGLRRTARALGAVRDMDVFLEKLALYQQELPPEAEDSLAPLREVCQQQRDAARSRLIKHLDSGSFARFVDDFEAFLTTPGAGARPPSQAGPVAHQVRHVVPRLIYERYGAVRAYETVLDHASIQTLHALRIDGKRLRYALEFFVEVLGPEARDVIEEVKTLQDHLGDLNDAEVAGNFLREFVSEHEKAQAAIQLGERRSIERVVQYMAHQFAEKHRLMVSFPEAWDRFNRREVRRALGLAVSAL